MLKDHHQGISTLLSFALIPLSGFATDIYIPSLPSMATDLHVSNAGVQLSLVIFMVSGGISQLFVGSILDSFGRYRIGIWSLGIFALVSFIIAMSHNIQLIYWMRILQGVTVALIVVGKRAYFVDVYSGSKLKHYTSLFSIIWATAPIIAPFVGGYLQSLFGWQSNFYFLGSMTLVILAFELIYGGETLRHFHPFKADSILKAYGEKLKTADFTLGLAIISLSYSMLVVYGLTSPFIIEHALHYSPVVTGYCSLLSGVALMCGGLISKSMIKRPMLPKVGVAIALQAVTAVIMIVEAGLSSSLYSMMAFVLVVHLFSGFVFNNVFAYCLGRFTTNAGITSGLTGGTLFALTAILSYGLASIVHIQSQAMLGGAYLIFAGLLLFVFFIFYRSVPASLTAAVPVTNALHA